MFVPPWILAIDIDTALYIYGYAVSSCFIKTPVCLDLCRKLQTYNGASHFWFINPERSLYGHPLINNGQLWTMHDDSSVTVIKGYMHIYIFNRKSGKRHPSWLVKMAVGDLGVEPWFVR